MADTENRLKALQQGGSTNGQPVTANALTPEQKAEIQRAQRDLMETRAELRDVQHNLRKDIDFWGTLLAWINIAFVPALVAIFAVVLAILRRRRRARAIAL